jgi:hypothetical protein
MVKTRTMRRSSPLLKGITPPKRARRIIRRSLKHRSKEYINKMKLLKQTLHTHRPHTYKTTEYDLDDFALSPKHKKLTKKISPSMIKPKSSNSKNGFFDESD